jgi:GT2 family glycosyltransferase
VRAEALPFTVTVLEQNPGRGAAAARNLGVTHARGELLLFLDDDIEPLPDLLAEHAAEHERAGPDAVVIGPPLPVRRPDMDFHALAMWAWWENQFALMRRPGHRFTYDNVFSGNLSLPRSLFARTSGFDVAFNSCRDDSELGLRLIRLGATIRFAPRAGAWHHELRDSAGLARRKRAEGIADVRLVRLYPELWPVLPLSLEPRPYGALGVVRELAFRAPRLGAALTGFGRRLLPLLEFWRMRGTWNRLQAGLMYFWYWHGAAPALGGRRALRDLERTAAAQRPASPLALDLSHGWRMAQATVDAARPAGVAVRWRSLPLAVLPPHPAAEAIGARHLAALLERLDTDDPRATLPAALPRPPVRMREVELSVRTSAAPVEPDAAPARTLLRYRGIPLGCVQSPATRLQDPVPGRVALLSELLPDGAVDEGRALPPISVVVCTRNRPALLARCLQSLIALDYPRCELLVVDNAPENDETRRVAEAAGVRYVREDAPGLDRARNRGWTSATHDIVAFTDDDVEVDRLWLRGLAHAFDDPGVGFVTGLVVPARLDTEAELLFEMAYGGMGKGMLPVRWDPATLSETEVLGAHHVGVGANMAFRRSLLQALGGFDPALDVGTPAHGGGDLDMFHRALVAGAIGRYEPRALLRHHHRATIPALRAQLYDNGRAFGVYLLRIFRQRSARRRVVVSYALAHAFGWVAACLIRRLARRYALPAPLIFAELRGLLHAPWAFRQTYCRTGQASRPGQPQAARVN